MTLAKGRFFRCKDRHLFAARVTVAVELLSAQPGVAFHCSGNGFFMQGYEEEVPAVGYDDWKAGAKAGIEYALAVADAKPARVDVTKIMARDLDTNPTVIGAAAAIATWKALGVEPSPAVIEALELVVFESWQRPHDQVPSFT